MEKSYIKRKRADKILFFSSILPSPFKLEAKSTKSTKQASKPASNLLVGYPAAPKHRVKESSEGTPAE